MPGNLQSMADITQRVGALEMRVNQLETWAGPGQAEALVAGMRDVRADLAGVHRELSAVRRGQDSHTAMLAEVLRRLPPPADEG